MRDTRLAKLAEVLVDYSTGVKKGNLVRISGPTIAEPLIVEIYRRVIVAGGYPMVRMSSEELDEIRFKTASEEQLQYVPRLAMQEVEAIDVSIGIWAEENTRALSGCDAKRMAMASKARQPIFDTFLKRGAAGSLKWTGTQYPTQASAQEADMSLAEYEDFVYSGGLLDRPDPAAAWREISKRQQRLADRLNGHRDYRVVAANGTDIRMSVDGCRWINCDGHENFPDGEVFSGPVIASVNGVVNFSFPAVHHGRQVTAVKLKFKDGKVVDASASKGQDFLYSMLDMDAGSRFLGECAIGTNYQIKRHTGNTLFDEKIGGTVHFALGAGYPETGNSNQSGLHWDMVVDLRAGGHIEIDGQKIAVDGKILGEGMPGPA
jgi:aminopeptidase